MKNMNIANKLTLLRILLIPFLMIFIFQNTYTTLWIALGIFIFAAITDIIDGIVARVRKNITKFGLFMDPLADKLVLCTALIAFVQLGWIAGWIALIIIAREFLVTGLRLIAVSEGVSIPAEVLGKIKTIFQEIAIGFLLGFRALIITPGVSFQIKWLIIPEIMFYIAVILTVISGIAYLIKNFTVIERDW